MANLDGISLDLPRLRGDLVVAYRLGRSHAVAQLGLPADAAARVKLAPAALAALPPDVEDAILALEQKAIDQLERSRRLFEDAEDLDAVLLGIDAARLAELRAEQGLVSLVHERINAGTADVATEAGAKLVWLAERDACLNCAAYSGRIRKGASFPWGLTFSDPPRPLKQWKQNLEGPPIHPWCFPAGVIASGPGTRSATDRWYEGEMVEIRTRGGRVLPVTPNHPVLADKGWIAAGLIHQGSNLVCDVDLQRVLARDPDDHQKPSLIEDVARTLSGASGVTSVSVPVAAEDFHGDGTDGEVQIVRTNGFLRDRIEILQELREEQFSGAGDLSSSLFRGSYPRAVLDGLAAASEGIVSGLGQSSPLLGAGLGHASEHGGRAVPGLDPGLGQHPLEGVPTDSGFFRQGLDALAGLVALDQVVEVTRRPFAGHVYNLETSGGWFISNGLIVHNCRCQLIGWNGVDSGGPGLNFPDSLAREAKRSIIKGWALPSESQSARQRAAARLLTLGAGLPPTVEARARAAVRSGRFRTKPAP